MTQPEFYGKRWDSQTVSVVFFILILTFPSPHLCVSVIGGGLAVHVITKGAVSYEAGAFLIIRDCYDKNKFLFKFRKIIQIFDEHNKTINCSNLYPKFSGQKNNSLKIDGSFTRHYFLGLIFRFYRHSL